MGLLLHNRVKLAALPVLAAVLALIAWHAQPGAAQPAVTAKAKSVSIKDDFFSPKTVHVAVGGTVTWHWRGQGDEHNVTFRKVPSGASKRRAGTRTTGKFTRSFKQKGTYRYVCTIHEDLGMKGSVIAG